MKNLILLMAGLFIIHLTAKSREIAEMQISKTVHSNETEMVASSVTQAVTAGQLSTILTAEELAGTTSLTLTGTIDARDFKTMRDLMPLLANLDISNVDIVEYIGSDGTSMENATVYPSNAIPEYAFMYKYSLLSIDMPISTTVISTFAFGNNWGLTSITISPNVLLIKRDAFAGCWNITQINISASVQTIENAFDGNQGLFYVEDGNLNYSSLDGVLFDKSQRTLISCPRSISGAYTIPNTVEIIEYIAFGGCYQITSIHIPSSVKIIRDGAFSQCHGIAEFELPLSIEFIGNHAFFYCTGITSFEVKWLKPLDLTGKTDVFLLANVANCTLKVPHGTSALYAAAEFWKDFQNIVEMEPEEKLTYVPDDNFEQALIDLGYDSGELDNYVPTAKISTLISLDVSGKGIEDLTGIEDFASLQTLNCSGNHLPTLILNKNLNLYGLDCGNNRISNLDVSTCTHLTNLQGYNNLISSLDLSNCVNLITIDVQTNQLTNIDISNNQKLVWLNLGNNPLTTLDITKNNELEALFCSNFQFTSIDLSQNINLISLGFYSGSLTALDVSKNQNLKVLWCHNNSLEHIDASKNTALTTLSCQNNQLTYLNVQNGNNSNMVADETGLNASGNPELYCIQVDNPLLAATYTNWTKDAHASYSSNCSPMPVVNYPSDADIVLNNGQTFNITWSDFSGTRVKIELMKENRVAATIVASTPNDGSHPYTIPASLQSGDDYRIMITSLEDRTVYDISDNFFAVQTLANPMVLVPSEPDIIWNNSKTYNILWSEYSGSKVRIELLKGNLVRSTIAASTANDGTHPWTIAKNLESGTDYKIRITSVENNSVTDISDHDFTIQPNTDKPGKKSAGIEFNTLSNHGESLLVFPNPFTHKVNFEILLKKSAPVVLEIFTVTGLKLSTLFDGFVDAGVTTRFEYQPEKIQAQILLYRLRIGDESETGKLIYKP